MAVVSLKGSRIITGLDTVPKVLADPGEGGGRVHYWCDTVETSATEDDSVSSMYELARIPSNARILGISKVHFDDLATTGSPTLDFGVYNIGSRTDITEDPDALNDGIDCATAASSAALIKDVANYGKRLWEYVNGQTTDPKCDLSIRVKLLDAAITETGTITLELFYVTD
jgi:hypothetical protein